MSRLLADTHFLYLKTRGYHWSVRGPMFHSLHQLLEAHHVELCIAVDEIAERTDKSGQSVRVNGRNNAK